MYNPTANNPIMTMRFNCLEFTDKMGFSSFHANENDQEIEQDDHELRTACRQNGKGCGVTQ